jgi:hypothetical protein
MAATLFSKLKNVVLLLPLQLCQNARHIDVAAVTVLDKNAAI